MQKEESKMMTPGIIKCLSVKPTKRDISTATSSLYAQQFYSRVSYLFDLNEAYYELLNV